MHSFNVLFKCHQCRYSYKFAILCVYCKIFKKTVCYVTDKMFTIKIICMSFTTFMKLPSYN
jgi:hypothetical protein